MRSRRSPFVLILSFLVLTACTPEEGGGSERPPGPVSPVVPISAGSGAAAEGRIERAVCAVSDVLLQRTWRGDRRDRSGDIQLLPEEPNFVGHGGLPHSGPWDYISDVPLLWYGPGHIRAAGEIDRRRRRTHLGAPSHTTVTTSFGTGAFSRSHGIVAHHFRIGETLTDPWTRGPASLVLPTIGDVYDRARDNEPLVGAIATVAIHLGMLGHGSFMTGGDRDLAVTREIEGAATLGAEGIRWRLTGNVSPYYDFPAYVNRLPRISNYFGGVDRSDGQLDGAWHGHDLAGPDTLGGFMTPARIPYQNDLIEEVVRREGFGADDVPDLFYIKYKLTDEIGHADSMNSVEMSDAVRATDAGLRELVGLLDSLVGEGEWVMAVTADHGHTPDPDVSGAYVISPTAVADVTNAAFDLDDDDVRVVEYTQPTEVFIDEDELAQHGYTLNDVSAFLMGLTFRDVGSPTWPVPDEDLDQPAFAAAYPSRLLDTLECVPRDA